MLVLFAIKDFQKKKLSGIDAVGNETIKIHLCKNN